MTERLKINNLYSAVSELSRNMQLSLSNSQFNKLYSILLEYDHPEKVIQFLYLCKKSQIIEFIKNSL